MPLAFCESCRKICFVITVNVDGEQFEVCNDCDLQEEESHVNHN